MKKKILVTGGTGYIGSHSIIDLIENGYDIVCVDSGLNSDDTSIAATKKLTGIDIPFYKTDLCDLKAIQEIFSAHQDIKGVIHFAALKSVEESVKNPFLYFRNNLESLINILEVSIKHQIDAFVFSSSCTVYGEAIECPVNEDAPLKEAASPYGRTKQIGEKITSDCIKNSKTKAVLLRYFNPAGAHPSGLLGESPLNSAQNLVPVITETAIGKRSKMMVFGNDYPTRDGSCIRDFIHVVDLAKAHTLALNHIFEGKQTSPLEVFNLGIGGGLSVLEIIHAFEEVSGVKLKYEIGPRRPGDIISIFSDYKKANQILGWKPEYDIYDIMRTAWAWEKIRSNK